MKKLFYVLAYNSKSCDNNIEINHYTTTAPTRTCYKYVAWYEDAKLKTKWNFETDKVTVNTTLYAGWKKNNN